MQSTIPENVKATSLEAYIAMIRFLEEYNKYLQSSDINGLLGDISLDTFGYMQQSADPSAWIAWENNLKEVLIESGALKKSI